MTKNNVTTPAFGSNFAKIDAHIITQEEYDEIPELMEEWFATADFHINGKLVKRGRPKGSGMKTAVKIRYDRDVLEAFRAGGKGWQTRMNDVLKAYIQEHPQ
jgi:uncharacterized protein (DUF4415 family)